MSVTHDHPLLVKGSKMLQRINAFAEGPHPVVVQIFLFQSSRCRSHCGLTVENGRGCPSWRFANAFRNSQSTTLPRSSPPGSSANITPRAGGPHLSKLRFQNPSALWGPKSTCLCIVSNEIYIDIWNEATRGQARRSCRPSVATRLDVFWTRGSCASMEVNFLQPRIRPAPH